MKVEHTFDWRIITADSDTLTMMVEYKRPSDNEPYFLNIPFPRAMVEIEPHINHFAPHAEWNHIDLAKNIAADQLVGLSGTIEESSPIPVETAPILFLNQAEVILP